MNEEEQVFEEGNLFVYKATHRIYYNTAKPVPIREVILALQGLEGVLKPLPKVVSSLTGIAVDDSRFLIQSIESGSLIEDIAIWFIFKDKEKMEAFIRKLGENNAVRYTVISAAIAATVVYGLHMATSDKSAPSITATNSIIINAGAGAINISPEAFSAAVHASIADKKGVAESALKLIGPARADPGSTVKFDGLELSSSAIAEAPARIELDANERIEEYRAVQLTIRATNLDSRKSGWAGKLGPREERLPIELDPAVAEADIFGRTAVIVDAALVFKEKGQSRELKPARIYVRKVIK